MPVRGPGRRRRRAPAGVRLRVYAPSDGPAVRRLWRDAGLYIGPSDTRSALERQRRRDPDLFLVAEDRGRIVGAALGRFDGRRGSVNHLAVAAEARSRGLGARLVREIEMRLRRKGCVKVNLHVEPSNAGVIAFYESVGYRPRDLLFLEKWLIEGVVPGTDLPPSPGPGRRPRAARATGATTRPP